MKNKEFTNYVVSGLISLSLGGLIACGGANGPEGAPATQPPVVHPAIAQGNPQSLVGNWRALPVVKGNETATLTLNFSATTPLSVNQNTLPVPAPQNQNTPLAPVSSQVTASNQCSYKPEKGEKAVEKKVTVSSNAHLMGNQIQILNGQHQSDGDCLVTLPQATGTYTLASPTEVSFTFIMYRQASQDYLYPTMNAYFSVFYYMQNAAYAYYNVPMFYYQQQAMMYSYNVNFGYGIGTHSYSYPVQYTQSFTRIQ